MISMNLTAALRSDPRPGDDDDSDDEAAGPIQPLSAPDIPCVAGILPEQFPWRPAALAMDEASPLRLLGWWKHPTVLHAGPLLSQ